jgi:hypothetical protein
MPPEFARCPHCGNPVGLARDAVFVQCVKCLRTSSRADWLKADRRNGGDRRSTTRSERRKD